MLTKDQAQGLQGPGACLPAVFRETTGDSVPRHSIHETLIHSSAPKRIALGIALQQHYNTKHTIRQRFDLPAFEEPSTPS